MTDDDYVLHLGSCLDPVTGLASIADKSVDHFIYDAPYSAHVHSKSMRGAKGWKGEISEVRELGFACITQEQIEAISGHAARMSKRWTLSFSDVESSHLWAEQFVTAGLEYMRTGAWVKIGGAPQFTGDRPAVAFEAIVIAHQPGKKRWNGGGKAGIWSVPIVLDRGAGERRVHTTQKPLALMEQLIRDFTDPGDLVVDPFSGSATTAVACKRLGRRFIGWEANPDTHALAVKRIAATREQLELGAVPRGPKPKQDRFAVDFGRLQKPAPTMPAEEEYRAPDALPKQAALPVVTAPVTPVTPPPVMKPIAWGSDAPAVKQWPRTGTNIFVYEDDGSRRELTQEEISSGTSAP